MQGKKTKTVKRVAVLFSDIVGSSSYFKKFGDAAGFEMIKNHNSLLSPIINEHEGIIVKTLGDSIMARFSNTLEATKCAIRMQKRLADYNNSLPSEHQILIRIGINYGKGIVDKNDIFGDAVNIASKITQLAGANQIMLSEEVYEHIKDEDHVYFSLAGRVEYPQSSKATNVFSLSWDDDVDFSPCLRSVLLIRPLYGHGDISEAIYQKTGKHPEKSSSSEDLMYYVFKSAKEAILVGKEVSDESDSNVKMIIHSSTDINDSEGAWQALDIDWEVIQPGVIYICNTTHKLLQKTSLHKELTLLPSAIDHIFRLQWVGSKEGSEDLFKYHEMFVAGANNRCFYCGSRRHHISQCPSKHISIKSNNLDRLGYLSFRKINVAASKGFDGILNHVQDYLTGELQVDRDPGAILLFAFFELTREFQLPFLRQVWGSESGTWKGIYKSSPQVDTAGVLLLGEDCIRVAKLQQAESMISAYLEQHPDDYKSYTAEAFLNIERGDFTRASQYLRQALKKYRTDLQWIYINLLLARLYGINGKYDEAASHIRDALRIDPYCFEAQYQNAVLLIKMGYISQGKEILRGVIKEDRIFIPKCLIDPELANARKAIDSLLMKTLNEAKDEAISTSGQAREHLELARNWFDDGSSKLKECEGMYKRIKDHISSESFFGYMDASNLSERLVSQIRKDIRQHQRDIELNLWEFKKKLDFFQSFYASYPLKHMYHNFGHLLVRNAKRCQRGLSLVNHDTPAEYREAGSLQKDIGHDLRIMEHLKRRMEFMRRSIYAIRSFLKRMAVFEGITLVTAFILYPLAYFYATNIFLGKQVFQTSDIAIYQRAIVYLGSFLSFLAAVCLSRVRLRK